MASMGHGLKIKYGLANDPSPDQSQRWADLTSQYQREGLNAEAAGDRAAKYLFRDYQTHHYATQADTIAYLLEQAGKKK